MEPLSTTGTLGVALAKHIGSKILESIYDVNNDIRKVLDKTLIDDSGKLSLFLQGILNNLGISRRIKKEILDNPTVFDLAGLAWGEILLNTPDIDFAAFSIPPSTIRIALSPRWFVSILLETAVDTGQFRNSHTTEMKPLPEFPDEYLNKIVTIITNEALDAIGSSVSPDVQHIEFIRTALHKLPSKIEELFLSIPGVKEGLIHLSTSHTLSELRDTRSEIRQSFNEVVSHTQRAEDIWKQVLERFDGTQTAQTAVGVLRQMAADAVAFLDKDVFGRNSVAANEFGFLPLERTYVEPLVSTKSDNKNRVLEQPALHQLIGALTSKDCRLVTLLAPFGFGKSLTVRMLTARLAEQWSTATDPQLFPLFVHAPDLLSSHAGTLESAISVHLERTLNVDATVSAWLWRNVSFAIMLDSFDEVILEKPIARSWIISLQRVAADSRHRVLLASRDHAIETQWLTDRDRQYIIHSFDEARITNWLQRTSGIIHDGSLTAKHIVDWLGTDLAGTPILLLMAAWDWQASGEVRVMSRTALYARFINRISKGKWEGIQELHPVVQDGAKVLESHHGEGAYQKALARLAWAHLVAEWRSDRDGVPNNSYVLPVGTVDSILRKEFRTKDGEELRDDSIRAVQKSIVLSVFIRRAEDSEGIRFVHKSFREYLCAFHLARCLRIRSDGPIYMHPGFLALCEAPLGMEEQKFAADLINDFNDDLRKEVLVLLDSVVDQAQLVLFQHEHHVKTHSDGERRDTILVFDQTSLRHSHNNWVNAESLALRIRRQSNILLALERFRTHQQVRNEPRSEDGFQVLQRYSCVSLCYNRNDDFLYCALDLAELQELYYSGGGDEENEDHDDGTQSQRINPEAPGSVDNLPGILDCFPEARLRKTRIFAPLPLSFWIATGFSLYPHVSFDQLSYREMLALYDVLATKAHEGWWVFAAGDVVFWQNNETWTVGPLVRQKSPSVDDTLRTPLFAWWMIVKSWWRLVSRGVNRYQEFLHRYSQSKMVNDQPTMLALLELSSGFLDMHIRTDHYSLLRTGVERLFDYLKRPDGQLQLDFSEPDVLLLNPDE